MNHEHDPRERFDIQIKTENRNIDLEGWTRTSALNYVNGLLKENPFDEYLQKNLPVVIAGFGFVSVSGNGKSISIRGYLPHTDTGEKHTCGRRMTEFGPWERTENIDTWIMVGDDKKCSFCGSMHPDRVLELVTQHGIGIIERTDKNYKWYINRANVPNESYGATKYYRHHDTPEFIRKYNEIVLLDKRN